MKSEDSGDSFAQTISSGLVVPHIIEPIVRKHFLHNTFLDADYFRFNLRGLSTDDILMGNNHSQRFADFYPLENRKNAKNAKNF